MRELNFNLIYLNNPNYCCYNMLRGATQVDKNMRSNNN
jgi:hypothetical protein